MRIYYLGICIIFQQRYKIIVNSNKFIFMIPWFSFSCYVHFAINEMNLYHNIFHRNNAGFSQNIEIPKIYRVKKNGKTKLIFCAFGCGLYPITNLYFVFESFFFHTLADWLSGLCWAGRKSVGLANKNPSLKWFILWSAVFSSCELLLCLPLQPPRFYALAKFIDYVII